MVRISNKRGATPYIYMRGAPDLRTGPHDYGPREWGVYAAIKQHHVSN